MQILTGISEPWVADKSGRFIWRGWCCIRCIKSRDNWVRFNFSSDSESGRRLVRHAAREEQGYGERPWSIRVTHIRCAMLTLSPLSPLGFLPMLLCCVRAGRFFCGKYCLSAYQLISDAIVFTPECFFPLLLSCGILFCNDALCRKIRLVYCNWVFFHIFQHMLLTIFDRFLGKPNIYTEITNVFWDDDRER